MLVGAVVVLGASVGPAAGAAGARNQPGFDQLAACLGSARRLQALYVIDMSGSNAQTDPGGARFEGLESSVVSLARLPRRLGASFQVDAAVAGFGDRYQPPDVPGGWHRVDAGNAAGVGRELRAAAERRWAELSKGSPQNTDYEAALGGARSSLRALGSARDTCRVVFWFTDGLFDLGSPGPTDAASRRICAPGGLVDLVRRDGVSVVALAFVNDAVRRQLDDPGRRRRRGELEAIAVGRSVTRRCGTVPPPEGYRAGVYLEARDAADLPRLFINGLPPGPGEPSTGRFQIDPGVRSFELDLTTTAEARAVAVEAPDGSRGSVPTSGVATAVGATLVTAWGFGTLVMVSADMPDDGLAGTWTVDPGVGVRTVEVHRFSGLGLRLNPSTRKAGSQTVVSGTVVGPGGAADLSIYRTATVRASQRGPRGSGPATPAAARMVDLAAGTFEVQVTPDPSRTRLELQADLTLVTRPHGFELAGGTASLVLFLPPPRWFPRAEPAALDLGTVRGRTPVSGQLSLVGSAIGATRVCLGPATDVEVPERAAGTRPSYPVRCHDLAAGQRRTVQVEVVPAASADGPGSAVIPLVLTSVGTGAGPSQTLPAQLDVTWTMEPRIDGGRRMWLEVLGVVLAVLLPLLTLWGVNRALARFDSGDSRRAAVDVLVDDGGPRRADGAPLLAGDDLRPQFIPPGTRSLEVPGAPVVLRASTPLNPFGGPSFVAEAGPGHRVVSGVPPRTLRDGLAAPVTPGLGNIWLLVVTDEELRALETSGTPARATLVVIVRGYGRELAEQLSVAVGHEPDWPGLLSVLRRAAVASAPAPGTDDPVKDRADEDDLLFKDPFR